MVETHQSERKTPVTILQTKIETKIYQYVVESDAPLEDCLIALQQITDHIVEIKKNIESQKEEITTQV